MMWGFIGTDKVPWLSPNLHINGYIIGENHVLWKYLYLVRRSLGSKTARKCFENEGIGRYKHGQGWKQKSFVGSFEVSIAYMVEIILI